MMQVVGEEGTSTEDFVVYLKSEFLDTIYLQQNSFDQVDAACSVERQKYLFGKVGTVLDHQFTFAAKEEARDMFFTLTEHFQNWKYSPWESSGMKEAEEKIDSCLGNGGGAVHA
jgi:V/A-type H+-transporting ATPase subunit A